MPNRTPKKPKPPSNEYGIAPVDRLKWLVALAKDKRFISTDVKTGVFLQNLVNRKKGYAFPRYAYLQEISGLSRASIARSIERMREAGAIKTEQQGRDRPLKYWLVAPELWEEALTDETSSQAKTSHPQGEEVSDVSTRNLTDEIHNSLNNPDDEHREIPPEIPSEADFMEALIEFGVFEPIPEP
jgi:DNA-binding transcriptional ArsR family regulator